MAALSLKGVSGLPSPKFQLYCEGAPGRITGAMFTVAPRAAAGRLMLSICGSRSSTVRRQVMLADRPPALLALMLTSNTPAASGVPLIRPLAGSMATPAGRPLAL